MKSNLRAILKHACLKRRIIVLPLKSHVNMSLFVWVVMCMNVSRRLQNTDQVSKKRGTAAISNAEQLPQHNCQ